MKFDKNHPKFTAYALGELSKEDRQKAKDYIAKHPELRDDVDELRALGTAIINELKAEPMPKLAKGRQQKIIERATVSAPRFYQRPPVIGGGILAVLAIIIFVVMPGNKKPSSPALVKSQKPKAQPTTQVAATPDNAAPQNTTAQASRVPVSTNWPKPTNDGLYDLADTKNPRAAAQPETAVVASTKVSGKSDGIYEIADNRRAGMPSASELARYRNYNPTTSGNPDFKLAAPSSGAMRKSGSYPGVEGVNNKKASGVNLSTLGLGAGKVLNKDGSGSVRAFQESAGGAGGGAGSRGKNFGFSGSGNASTVGIAGGGGLNNFGSGAGGSGGFGGLGNGVAQPQYYYHPQPSESYAYAPENEFVSTSSDSLSTFAIDVDTASYSNIRRFINNGQTPPADAVRIEEMINYFDYNYAEPTGDKPFAMDLAVASSPWKPENRLVRIGLKAKDYHGQLRPRLNLTFLVDVSGSMQAENKLPLVKRSLKLLAEQLTGNDTVTIVTYAGDSGVLLEPTPGNQFQKIMDAVDSMSTGGGTNGSAGLELAYQQTLANFSRTGVNRVIIASDGDFNVGMTSRQQLHSFIEEKAKTGIYLTVLGYGMGNYKDSTLELLADKGDGNYAYIDSFEEAKKVFTQQLTGTLITIAKDTKLQVEFNPEYVQSYRLIGYENRGLAHQDFTDDAKDAGDIGAGHTVTALYEVVPKYNSSQGIALKYSSPKPSNAEILTVKVRSKRPVGGASVAQEFTLRDQGQSFSSASNDFRWAAAVAGFGMILRNSAHKGNLTNQQVAEIAQGAAGSDRNGHRAEFINLMRKSKDQPQARVGYDSVSYRYSRNNIAIPEGDPKVSGGLTTQEIMAVLRANLNQIRHCYEQLLQRSPNARGKIKTKWSIGLDGRTKSVSVAESTIGDSQMRGCVTGKIQRWDYPKPRGDKNVEVEYPFVFSPR